MADSLNGVTIASVTSTGAGRAKALAVDFSTPVEMTVCVGLNLFGLGAIRGRLIKESI